MTSGLVAVVYALLVVPNAILGRIFLGAKVLAGVPRRIAGGVPRHRLALPARDGGRRGGPACGGDGDRHIAGGVLSASAANIMQATAAGAIRADPRAARLGDGVGRAVRRALALRDGGAAGGGDAAAYWAGIAYLGVIGSAITFPLYFRRDPGDRAGAGGLYQRADPGDRDGALDAVRGLSLVGGAAAGGVLVLAGLVIALAAKRQ